MRVHAAAVAIMAASAMECRRRDHWLGHRRLSAAAERNLGTGFIRSVISAFIGGQALKDCAWRECPGQSGRLGDVAAHVPCCRVGCARVKGGARSAAL